MSRTTSRVIFRRERRMRRRLAVVQSALAIGSPARLTMVSIGVSLAIWSSEVTSRNGGVSAAALAGSRASTVTGCPASASAATRRLPMKPVAPVMRTCCRSGRAATSSAARPAVSCPARRAAK